MLPMYRLRIFFAVPQCNSWHRDGHTTTATYCNATAVGYEHSFNTINLSFGTHIFPSALHIHFALYFDGIGNVSCPLLQIAICHWTTFNFLNPCKICDMCKCSLIAGSNNMRPLTMATSSITRPPQLLLTLRSFLSRSTLRMFARLSSPTSIT